MADDKNSHIFIFGVLHQAHRTFLDLRCTTRRGGQIPFINGLDRVHDQDIRFHLLSFLDDLLHIRFGQNV